MVPKWRKLVTGGLWLLLIIIGLRLFIEKPRLKSWVVLRLQEILKEVAAVDITYGSVHIGLFPPRLKVYDLDIIWLKDPNSLQLHLASFELKPRLWFFKHGVLSLKSLKIEGLQGDIDLQRLQQTLEASNATTQVSGQWLEDYLNNPQVLPVPLRIQELTIRNVFLSLRYQQQRLEVHDLDVMIDEQRGDEILELHVEHGFFQDLHQQKIWPIQSQLRLCLEGGLQTPRALRFDSGFFRLGELQIEPHGFIKVLPTPQWQWFGSIRLPMHVLGALWHEFDDYQGELQLEGEILGALTDPKGTFHVTGSDLATPRGSLGQGQGELIVDKFGLIWDRLQLREKNRGLLLSHGRIDFQPLHLHTHVEAHGSQVLFWLESLFGEDYVPLKSDGSLEVDVRGSIKPLDLDIHSEAQLANSLVKLLLPVTPQIHAVNSSQQNPNQATPVEPLSFWQLPHWTALVQLGLRHEHLDVNEVIILLPHCHVVAAGNVLFGKKTQVTIDGQAEGIDWSDWGLLGGSALHGEGSSHFSLRGPLSRVVLDLGVDVKQLEWRQLWLKQGHMRLHYSNRQLDVDDFELSLSSKPPRSSKRSLRSFLSNRLKGRWSMNWQRGRQPLIESHLKLSELEFLKLLNFLWGAVGATLPTHFYEFSGLVSGHVDLTGPLYRPEGSMHLQVSALRYFDLPLGQMMWKTFFSREKQWSAQSYLTLQKPPEHKDSPKTDTDQSEIELSEVDNNDKHPWLKAEGIFLEDQTLQIKGFLSRLPLSPFVGWLGYNFLTGTASANIELSGPWNALQGQVALDLADLNRGNWQLGDIETRIHLEPDKILFDSVFLKKSSQLQAEILLQENFPYHLLLSTRNLNVAHFFSEDPLLSSHIDFTLESQGPLFFPERCEGQLLVQRAELLWQHLQAENQEPWRLTFQKGLLQIPLLKLIGQQMEFSAEGFFHSTGQISLHVDGHGDASLLRAWMPDVAELSGPYDLSMTAAGTFNNPQLKGQILTKNLLLRLDQGGHLFEHLQGELLFDEKSLILKEVKAVSGQGNITFSGQAKRYNNKVADMELRGHFHQLPLTPYDQLECVVTGDLQLTGPVDRLSLRGGLTIESLLYTAKIDFERLIQKTPQLPLRVPKISPTKAIALDIHLLGKRNLLINSKFLNAELSGDVLLTGTTERPGLLGKITSLSAQAQWADNTYRIQRASFDFVEEYRLVMDFQVQAHTEACNMRIDVNAQGSSDNFKSSNIQVYGQDNQGTVTTVEVLHCLQAGVRSYQQPVTGTTQNIGDQSQAASGLVDAFWAVSGLDDKVKKLLPVQIDELRVSSALPNTTQLITPRSSLRMIVGKKLAEGLMIRYSQPIAVSPDANDYELSLDYHLQKQATLQVNGLTLPFFNLLDIGVDLKLQWDLR